MDESLKRAGLVNQYKAYSDVVSEKGLSFNPLTDEELTKLSTGDLARLVREVKDLARTPT